MTRPRTSRTLAMQRLALQTIRGDVEAAVVLGDAQQELGKAIPTGRVRRVPYAFTPRDGYVATVHVPVQENLTGLDRFASEPTYRNWSRITVSFPVTPRDVYRQLRTQGLLPRRVGAHVLGKRFGDLSWVPRSDPIAQDPRTGPGWAIYDETVKTRGLRPQPLYLGEVVRDDVSGPHDTWSWTLQRVRPSIPLVSGI